MRVLRAIDNQKKKKASKIVIKDFFFINYNQGMHEKKNNKNMYTYSWLGDARHGQESKTCPIETCTGQGRLNGTRNS